MTTKQEDRAIRKTNRNLGRERLNEEGDDEEWDMEFTQVLEDIQCGDADDEYQKRKDDKFTGP